MEPYDGFPTTQTSGFQPGGKKGTIVRWDGERYTPTGSWAFAASSATDNIAGATELVKWMSGVESGVRIWNEAKSLPSTYKAFDQIDIFQTDENYKALYEQLSKYGHPRPKTPVYPQVSTSFQQALESVGLGGKDAGIGNHTTTQWNASEMVDSQRKDTCRRDNRIGLF